MKELLRMKNKGYIVFESAKTNSIRVELYWTHPYTFEVVRLFLCEKHILTRKITSDQKDLIDNACRKFLDVVDFS